MVGLFGTTPGIQECMICSHRRKYPVPPMGGAYGYAYDANDLPLSGMGSCHCCCTTCKGRYNTIGGGKRG